MCEKNPVTIKGSMFFNQSFGQLLHGKFLNQSFNDTNLAMKLVRLGAEANAIASKLEARRNELFKEMGMDKLVMPEPLTPEKEESFTPEAKEAYTKEVNEYNEKQQAFNDAIMKELGDQDIELFYAPICVGEDSEILKTLTPAEITALMSQNILCLQDACDKECENVSCDKPVEETPTE
jgi:hypothetical protein